MSDDLNTPAHQADLLQSRYFQQVLIAQRNDLALVLDRHTANFGHAELAHDEWRMQYERRQIQMLESEAQKLAAMLDALQRRFHSAPAGLH
jgi:hypothetical protein